MKAAVLTEVKKPLEIKEVPIPEFGPDEVLVRVLACGVCRTDLHIVDGELPSPKLPLIPGHQIVGIVERAGRNVVGIESGERIGIPWLAKSCGKCRYCLEEKENLCDNALFTGYLKDGGFAEYCVADYRFVFPLAPNYSPTSAAPLLCAGMIGYRALRLTEGSTKIGFFGFGSSAHLLAQVVKHAGGEIFAFVRKENEKGKKFAKKFGATWVGSPGDMPPEPLDAAILFAPVGEHYPMALKVVKKGGIVVSAGIHMSDIPSFPYRLLWEERVMRSVTNLTREDGRELLELAPQIPIYTATTLYPLERVNEALDDLRHGRFEGTAVIKIA